MQALAVMTMTMMQKSRRIERCQAMTGENFVTTPLWTDSGGTAHFRLERARVNENEVV